MYEDMTDDELWDALLTAEIGWREYGDPEARTKGMAVRLELGGRGYTVR